uniref:Uncharacterized protein n=1 Tax=uncultured marine virus TaxID=186617 RepID=A0A0F7L7V3_9VIRU|nr:hypothetical protein [uncultured marine virus]
MHGWPWLRIPSFAYGTGTQLRTEWRSRLTPITLRSSTLAPPTFSPRIRIAFG